MRSPGVPRGIDWRTARTRAHRAHARRSSSLAWRLETKWGVHRDDRRSREATTDGRGLLLRLSFLVHRRARYVPGLRGVRKPQPRFRRGGEADACRTGSTAHPWCRCKWPSSAACRGQASWSMSSPTSAELPLLAVAARRENRGTCDERDRTTRRARLSAGGTAPARRTAEAGPAMTG